MREGHTMSRTWKLAAVITIVVMLVPIMTVQEANAACIYCGETGCVRCRTFGPGGTLGVCLETTQNAKCECCESSGTCTAQHDCAFA